MTQDPTLNEGEKAVSDSDLAEYIRRLPSKDEFVGFARTAPIPVSVLRSTFTELLSRRSTANPVLVVKGLFWSETVTSPGLRGGSHAYARSILGDYKVWGDGSWSDPHNFHNTYANWRADLLTIDAAKAACEADYTARIMSALVPSTGGEQTVAARPLDEWHEDFGSVVWWALDTNGQWFGEPAYIGTPLDIGRGYQISVGDQQFVAHLGGWPGYHTHWTPHPGLPPLPAHPDIQEAAK